MLARELLKGDVYCDTDGTVQVTVLSDATPDGFNPVTGVPQIHVGVEFRDGGHSPRWFDADAEVPYTRPESEEDR